MSETGDNDTIPADDMNAWKMYGATVPNDVIMADSAICQRNLLEWGNAIRGCFDHEKQPMHVLSLKENEGSDFRILGILYDPRLAMKDAVAKTAAQCRWKLCVCYGLANTMLMLSWSQCISRTCFPTSSIARQVSTTLVLASSRDRGYRRCPNEMPFPDRHPNIVDALLRFRLVPLRAKRDIAMVSLIGLCPH